jgi:hypothetical protein
VAEDQEQNLARGLEDALSNEQSDDATAVPNASQARPTTQASDASQQAAPAGEPQGESGGPAPLWQTLGYPSAEAAQQAFYNTRNDRARQETEKNEWKSKFEALQQQVNGVQNGFGRMDPAGYPAGTPPTQVDPLTQLETEFHVPRALLEPGVERLVNDKVGQILGPLVRTAQAEQKALETYGPEYGRLKPQIDHFVATHPDVSYFVNQARNGGMPEVANEYAFTRFREAVVASTHGSIKDQADATSAATSNSRTHAGVLSGRGEETRSRLAQQQSGSSGIDRNEAIARSNAGDDSLMERKAAEMLPFSEDYLQQVWRGERVV